MKLKSAYSNDSTRPKLLMKFQVQLKVVWRGIIALGSARDGLNIIGTPKSCVERNNFIRLCYRRLKYYWYS